MFKQLTDGELRDVFEQLLQEVSRRERTRSFNPARELPSEHSIESGSLDN